MGSVSFLALLQDVRGGAEEEGDVASLTDIETPTPSHLVCKHAAEKGARYGLLQVLDRFMCWKKNNFFFFSPSTSPKGDSNSLF